MNPLEKHVLPSRAAFEADPLGYSALAWQKWALAQTLAGFPTDPTVPPTSRDLKSPVLWLSQAQALSEAARILLQSEPNLDHLPVFTRGVCDSQYCAVALMLVGYSLEVCLKAMLLIQKGVDAYADDERAYKHHRLQDLATFVPNLSDRDRAILRALTHFVSWAGRYPDPGSGRESSSEEIFAVSEQQRVSARDLFDLAARVMGHVRSITA